MSQNNSKQVDTNGNWKDEKNGEERSILLPPVIYLIDNNLIITNLCANSDITIRIENSRGEEIYRQVIDPITAPEEVIPLYAYPAGSYILHLTNSYNSHLYGDFEITSTL